MDLTRCPECGAVAEILWRTELESTDGPVEHAKVLCISRHSFFLPSEALPRTEPLPDRPQLDPRPAHGSQGDDDGHEREEVTGPTLEEDREHRDAKDGHRQDQRLSPRRPLP